MAINIKTKILLPRGSVSSFAEREFTVGELVLLDAGEGKFEVVKITTAGTGLEGDNAAKFSKLAIDLATSGLSAYADIKNALSSDGYALSADVNSKITSEIATAKSELEGQISDVADTVSGNKTAIEKALADAKSELEGQITDAENAAKQAASDALAEAKTALEGQISGVNGKVTTLEGTVASNKTELEGKITDAKKEASDALAEAKTEINSAIEDGLAEKNKVQVRQTYIGDDVQTDLSVIKVTDEDLASYAQDLKDNKLNDNALYVFDLSAMNALGQKIENVGAPQLDTDAATKAYVDAVASGLGGDLVNSYYTKTEVNEISVNLATATSTVEANALTAIAGAKSELEGKINTLETTAALSVANALTAANMYTDNVAANLTSFVEKSELSIAYDSDAKKIKLFGGATESEIDASAFIKDGMLDSAAFNPDTKQITLTFNTESGKDAITIDVSKLVDTYTAKANAPTVQLKVENNEFSADIVPGSITPAMLSAEAEWIFDCN